MVHSPRDGGCITPHYTKVIKHHAARHSASIQPHPVIRTRDYNPATQTGTLTTDPTSPDLQQMDYIYVATGARADIRKMPLLSRKKKQYLIEIKVDYLV